MNTYIQTTNPSPENYHQTADTSKTRGRFLDEPGASTSKEGDRTIRR